MTQPEFQDIVDELAITEYASPRKWFGMPGLMANGYIFCALWRDRDLVCKLREDDLQAALTLEGACLFDPGGDGHPFKAWAQIPPQHHDQWLTFARSTLAYVRDLPPKERKKRS